MAIRVIVGKEPHSDIECSVLFCSTTGAVLGKAIAGGADRADAFLAWYLRQSPQPGIDWSPEFRRLSSETQYGWIELWEKLEREGEITAEPS